MSNHDYKKTYAYKKGLEKGKSVGEEISRQEIILAKQAEQKRICNYIRTQLKGKSYTDAKYVADDIDLDKQ